MVYAIIAAGEGSRLLQEGFKGLKPMVPIQGEMLIDRLIRIFIQNRATSIIILVNEQSEALVRHLEEMELPVPLAFFVNNTPSSFHSFYRLVEMSGITDEEICLTTTDSVFDEADFRAFIDDFTTVRNNDGVLAVTSYVDDEKPLYIQFNDEMIVNAITDVPAENNVYVSGGMYCLRKKALDMVHEAMEQGIEKMRNFQRLMLTGGLTLKAFPFGTIIDIDHVSDIKKAEAFLKDIQLQNNT